MHWQRSTTTGKKFTVSCIPAKPTMAATVAAMEFDEYLDNTVGNETPDESFTSSTQPSQQSTRGQGGGRGVRGTARGNRGRGGRGLGASTGGSQRPFISRDTEDGNHPNYKQTPDGQLQRSIHGFPLCNYCGGPSHKRQNCPVKIHDRAAGNKRIHHPDRDKGTSVQDKKKQDQARTSATMMAPIGPQIPYQQQQQLWQYNPWPQTASAAIPHRAPQTTQEGHQCHQNQLGPIGSNMQDFHHKSAATTMTPRQHPMSNPCPYPTCHATLTDYNQTQEHMNHFHTIPTLARGPGAEP